MMIEDIFRDIPTLETGRIILRPMRMDDADDIFAYASDPEVAKHVVWDTHASIEDSKSFLGSVLEQYNNGMVSSWGIEERASGKLIGTCGFVYWNITHARAEIGYALGRAYWGRGYMTEAAGQITAFGFESMKLNRLEARCEVANVGSAKVMQKIGMSYEGILRQQIFVKGHYQDLMMYSILRSEWER